MDEREIRQLALLRAAVGFLGELASPCWWQYRFSTDHSHGQQVYIVPRTALLAQVQGVASAAAVIHDERIGAGQSFHLFRLPKTLEQNLRTTFEKGSIVELVEVLEDDQSAREFLEQCARGNRQTFPGPVRVGPLASLWNESAWPAVAAYYLSGFERQQETFPFFSDWI